MPREIEFRPSNGFLWLFGLIAADLAMTAGFVTAIRWESVPLLLSLAVLLTPFLVLHGGFFIVQPNEAKALVLFGTYKGTVRTDGFWWANPFLSKRAISLRIRNFETSRLKVNDRDANPIEVGAVVVWRVVDSAEALFEVDDYATYVAVQSESAVRAVAVQYPYDGHDGAAQALSTHPIEVSEALQAAVQDRLAKAGVEVVEARLSHLAYAPEIAAAMLQRQQASAIIAARQKIVEGAVGMVDHALELLSQRGVVTLDEERKAAMVSNLLVVLCSERASQPVVNTGSLYT